jgi:preprotein translocase subunit YajC
MSGGGLIVIVVLFALFWLLLLRPQRRQAAIQRELIASLEPGDEIVTAGGLYGVITEIEGEELHVEISDGLVVRLARNAVVGLVERDDEEEDEEEEDEEEEPDESPEDDESEQTQANLPRT